MKILHLSYFFLLGLAANAQAQFRLGTTPCGDSEEASGFKAQKRVANGSSWTDTDVCLMDIPARGTNGAGYEKLSFSASYDSFVNEPEFYGWSHYVRAFDLQQDTTPVQEFGWGQWIKPAETGSLVGCDQTALPILDTGYQCFPTFACDMESTIEGGMGYWQYSFASNHVKWILPSSTNRNYEVFGGTLLNDREQLCTNLGGAVRVSNSLVLPNSFVSFEKTSNDDGLIDGFLGYQITKTPIGKRSADDEANYWTIVIDAKNFAGPVMYMAAWFWDNPNNQHPETASWSNPRMILGSAVSGVEGGIGAIRATMEDGTNWFRSNQWAIPRDQVNGEMTMTTTWFVGHSQWRTDWAKDVLEPILAGEVDNPTPESVLNWATAAARTPECLTPDPNYPFANVQLAFDATVEGSTEEDIRSWTEFGVEPDFGASLADAEAAGCHMQLTIDSSKLDCDSKPGWCLASPYLKYDASGATEIVSPEDVPEDVLGALGVHDFEPTKVNDGRFLQPRETNQACFEKPGPTPKDARLYCTRTSDDVWVGFKWYRFVDQPELNQVFASLPEGERDAARCFMQRRIERLHSLQQSASIPRWFQPPQGLNQLPADLVSIDEGLLVEPPPGLEVGFVPVPVIESYREKPAGCEVTVGPYSTEPNPLPPDYFEPFEGFEWREICELNESVYYPGQVYQQSVTSKETPVAHLVPRPSELNDLLPSEGVACGLPSDPSGTAQPSEPPTALPTEPPVAPPMAPPTEPPVAPPTVPPTEPPVASPTAPPIEPPVAPPTVPPTAPPIPPPTAPPTQPPVAPPTAPPTEPPVAPPTEPPTLPPTAPLTCNDCDKGVCSGYRCLFRGCDRAGGPGNPWVCAKRNEPNPGECEMVTRSWTCESCAKKGSGRRCCKGCVLSDSEAAASIVGEPVTADEMDENESPDGPEILGEPEWEVGLGLGLP